MDPKEISHTTIVPLLDFLEKTPGVLGKGKPNRISILFQDLRKRFTEFYRIEVQFETSSSTVEKKYFWVRIVKNKPTEEILASQTDQFAIMERLFVFFRRGNTGEAEPLLASVRPVAHLPEYRAIITAECHGTLFNSYLRKRFPLLTQKEILSHCFNAGKWLSQFHRCFRQEDSDHSLIAEYVENYTTKYSRSSEPKADCITLCHNDYSPRNIFVSDNRIEVIDFVGSKPGLPEADITFFCNYIRNAKFNLLYPNFIKNRMILSFQNGYQS